MLLRVRICSATTLFILLLTVLSYEHQTLRRGRSLDRLSLPSLGSPVLLKPRASLPPYYINSEWLVDHHDFHCMLPLATAAATLQDFYRQVAALAATTLTPALRHYQICFGQIMLDVASHPSSIIDWEIVQHFALQMVRFTQLGYTNTYQINFIHQPTGNMVTFSLYTGLRRAVTGGIP